MRGFTLIELIVVLAVLGLIAVITTAMLPRDYAGETVRAAAREVDAGLRAARSLAITANRDESFAVDVQSRLIRVGSGGRSRRLPSALDIRIVTTTGERIGSTGGAIVFFPDGTSTGGSVELRQGGQSSIVVVDWLTGEVSTRDE